MPIYSFENKETGAQWDETMSYDDKVAYLKENPHIQSIITKAPGIGDPMRLGRVKPDDGFRDRLKDIKSSHYGSTLNIL